MPGERVGARREHGDVAGLDLPGGEHLEDADDGLRGGLARGGSARLRCSSRTSPARDR